jgi:hypothetical protein
MNSYNNKDKDYLNSECRNLANARKHDLYALQYGSQCFTGSKNINYKINGNKIGGTNTIVTCTNGTGGAWANDVYVKE